MRYEWLIGVRYLMSNSRKGAPSIITVFSVTGVAIGVSALILVLSIMGGFEGDLRDKILGTKAHLLITGPSQGELVNPQAVLNELDQREDVLGASPFVESEVMISSPTNYAGIVLRGIDVERITSASSLQDDMIEGDLNWLLDPANARRGRSLPERDPDDDADPGRETEELLRETERLLDELGERLGSGALADNDGSGATSATRPGSGAGIDVPEVDGPSDSVMPSLPRPRTGDDDSVMPSLPRPRTDEERASMPLLPPPRADRNDTDGDDADGSGQMPAIGGERQRRHIPGIIIGTELQETLNCRVGDLVDIISPDGDLGPTGPIPRSRRFRVVGIFYTGLFEYDNKMVYTTLEASRTFLNVPEDVVTGIEVRIDRMDRADQVASELRTQLASNGVDDVEVHDWMTLNSSLFGALMLEKIVMFVLLALIIAVASFMIVCVLTMVVIEKGREIAILRSMGATGRGIMGVFLVEGGIMGLVGTALGAILGLGLTTYLQVVGFPLDPEVYYIDRLPVEVDTVEVVLVLVTAIAISLLATLYPSVQAARLDPVDALRYE